MSDFGLGDSWKLHHPHEQKYSYISQAHHSFTRTDFFIVSNTLHSDISERWICSKMISDHSPVFGHFKKNYQPQSITGWIFNKSLLSDQDFIDFFRKGLGIFCGNNWFFEHLASTSLRNPQGVWPFHIAHMKKWLTLNRKWN